MILPTQIEKVRKKENTGSLLMISERILPGSDGRIDTKLSILPIPLLR